MKTKLAPPHAHTNPRKPIDLDNRLALRVSEVSRLIGVSSATVRAMIQRGEIPGRRVGSGERSVSYVVPLDGLRRWLGGAAGIDRPAT